jgi:predicted ribosome quality control (RQC) complex YloA/Tae2 family protein
MSLNWREIAVVVSELPLEGSLIQRVNQIGFHTLVFELHHPESGFWQLYTEFGTPTSRLHRLTGPARAYRKKKTKKLQRFIQFMRAHIEGARIVSVTQPARDRLLVLKTIHGGMTMHLIFR